MARALLWFVLAASALAQQKQRSVVFYWENDSLGSPFGAYTDNDYTNGLRLAIGTLGKPRWERAFLTFCGHHCLGDASQASYALTHQFYTPTSILHPRPVDRPWAGYFALSANLQVNDEKRQHSLELQAGVLGQGAGAQYVQTKWHQLTGGDTPCCWQRQLKNEPMLNFSYTYTRRARSEHVPYADALATGGFALGTLRTYPAIGGTVRAGYHLTGFPMPTLEQEAPRLVKEEAAAPPESRPRVEFYVMAGADARYMLHDSTLDGGFFRDGPSVEKIPFGHDYRIGFSGRIDSFRLSYNLVTRSSEFEHFRDRNENHNYHSLMLGWEPAR